MIELPPISPSYPIKKPGRVIRERENQPEQHQSSNSDHKKETEQLDDLPSQHIDEIV